MQKIAVFIDRDGVVNYDPGNFHKIDELVIFPRVSKAIKLLNKHSLYAIVVTNQSVVARGWITEKDVQAINTKISSLIAKDRAEITKFYYCPHHPDGSIPKYSVVCNCRKPATGMFDKAADEFNFDLKKAYVIGDSFKEIEAAKKIGAKSIAVLCGRSDFGNSKADYVVSDLYEAVKLIISLL